MDIGGFQMTKESAAVEVYQTYKLVHLALLSSEPLLDVIRARGWPAPFEVARPEVWF